MNYIEHVRDAVFSVQGLLTPAECQQLVARTEEHGFAEAPISTPMGFVRLDSVRNNTRVMFDDPGFAQTLWSKVGPFVPAQLGDHRAVGLNERFRVYRYQPGQYFKLHTDGYYRRSKDERSFLTMMIYLNDDFEGGETAFDSAVVTPERGSALFFLHPLRHEGRTVTKGTKYAIRTDVMYRR